MQKTFTIEVFFNIYAPSENLKWINLLKLTLSGNSRKRSNTQTICRQQPTNCLSMFDHFVGMTNAGDDQISVMYAK